MSRLAIGFFKSLAPPVLWLVVSIIALFWGSYRDWHNQVFEMIFWQIRLPRVILASVIGASLSVSGAALQTIFLNPLAEPYTLGVSSGAALGAVLMVVSGLGTRVGAMLLPILGQEQIGYAVLVSSSAFCGAGIFAFIMFVITWRRGISAAAILLVGIVLGFFGSAMISLMLATTDSAGIQSALHWILGDLSRADQVTSVVGLCTCVLGITLLLMENKNLDALLTGEDTARSLGFDIDRDRRKLLLIISLLVGVSVSIAGMIGFVGLLVPHLLRKFGMIFHRALLWNCIWWGALVLVLSDLVGRTFWTPMEIPVGVITALVGAPVLAFLLIFPNRFGGERSGQ